MQRIVRDQFLEPTDGTEVIILGKLYRTAELSRKIAVNVRNPCASAGDVNTLSGYDRGSAAVYAPAHA